MIFLLLALKGGWCAHVSACVCDCVSVCPGLVQRASLQDRRGGRRALRHRGQSHAQHPGGKPLQRGDDINQELTTIVNQYLQ